MTPASQSMAGLQICNKDGEPGGFKWCADEGWVLIQGMLHLTSWFISFCSSIFPSIGLKDEPALIPSVRQKNLYKAAAY